MTSPTKQEAKELAKELVEAVSREPSGLAFLPALRSRIIALLRQALLDKAILDEYTEALAKFAEPNISEKVSSGDEMDWPVDEIAKDGLDILNDEQLVRVATDADGLALLASFLWETLEKDGNESFWWSALANEIATENTHAGGSSSSATSSDLLSQSGKGTDDQRGTVSSAGRRLRYSFAAVSSIAASLIIGFFVGQGIDAGPQVHVAQLRVSGERGSHDEHFDLHVTSPISGYLTVITFSGDVASEVIPQRGAEDMPIRPDVPVVISLKGVESAVAVITETPADETIRRLLRDEPAPDALQERLQTQLQAKGYRKIALNQTEVVARSRLRPDPEASD